MDQQNSSKKDDFLYDNWELHDRIFSEDNMYAFVERAAEEKGLESTLIALPLMKTFHSGQTRRGKEQVPYINHPLLMACHALALGLEEDDLISVILLHDVCEDCGIEPDELPFNQEIQEAVSLVTYKKDSSISSEEAHDRYYEKIKTNRLAVITKILDRCNNVSMMTTAFDRKKIISYIEETEHYVLPLLEILKNGFERRHYTTAFLLKYHLLSVLESDKHLLKRDL